MLKLLLIVLIFLFLLLGAAALLLSRYQDKVEREHRKQETIEKLESIPVVTPTPAVTITPTPLPTATPTPTPMVTVAPAFTPENYMGQWYSSDGLASVQIYELTNKYVSLYSRQRFMPRLPGTLPSFILQTLRGIRPEEILFSTPAAFTCGSLRWHCPEHLFIRR